MHIKAAMVLFLGIARTNALPLGSEATESGLFLEASSINHPCSHNAQNIQNGNPSHLTIHVFKDARREKRSRYPALAGQRIMLTGKRACRSTLVSTVPTVCALSSLHRV